MKTKEKLDDLDMLLEKVPELSPPGAGDFTLTDIMHRKGWHNDGNHRQKASRIVKSMLAEGLISSRKGTQNGKVCNVYRRK